MSQQKPKRPPNVSAIIREGFQRTRRSTARIIGFAFFVIMGVVGLLHALPIFEIIDLGIAPTEQLAIELGVIVVFFFLMSRRMKVVRDQIEADILKHGQRLIRQELHDLRVGNRRAKSLQQMAATLSATLSYEKVMEVSLDVCSLALEEMGLPTQSLVAAVFLYEGEVNLVSVATRRFTNRDGEQTITGNAGIIAQALKDVEPKVTYQPATDPELALFVAFQNCQAAICIPLRAGFQIFGVMIIASDEEVQFTKDHLDLFNAVTDQAVIALQNAQLFQDLESEKQRLIEADEEARKELARNLHDGPTQSVAAIAMHLNFIRSVLAKDPQQAMTELAKVEKLAKDTSKEIRQLLFALRPLVLESDGLGAAIETMIEKIKETDKLNLRLIGGDVGNLLQEQAQGVVFSIIEEAVGNARKYSEAQLVEIRLWREGNLFVARVQDNGVGFDVEAVNSNYSSRGSLGMVNMKERAERIDGNVKVESRPGKGTMVTLVVPLSKQGKNPLNA